MEEIKEIQEIQEESQVKKFTAKDLRDAILSANDLSVTPVQIPEWGGITVYIRSMTSKERDDWQASYFLARREDGKVSVENISASLMVKMLCADPEGKERIFQDSDIQSLGEKSAVVINRLQEALRDASGVSEADKENFAKNLNGQNDVFG